MHYMSLTETYAHHIRDETENEQDNGFAMSETNENVRGLTKWYGN